MNHLNLRPQSVANEFFVGFVHQLRTRHPWTVGLAKFADFADANLKVGSTVLVRNAPYLSELKPFEWGATITQTARAVTMTQQLHAEFRLYHGSSVDHLKVALVSSIDCLINAVVSRWPRGVSLVTGQLPLSDLADSAHVVSDPSSGFSIRMVSYQDIFRAEEVFRFDILFGFLRDPLTPAEEDAVSYLRKARARFMLQLERMQT